MASPASNRLVVNLPRHSKLEYRTPKEISSKFEEIGIQWLKSTSTSREISPTAVQFDKAYLPEGWTMKTEQGTWHDYHDALIYDHTPDVRVKIFLKTSLYSNAVIVHFYQPGEYNSMHNQ